YCNSPFPTRRTDGNYRSIKNPETRDPNNKCGAAWGSAGNHRKQKAKKPDSANFSMTAARIIEPAVGASVCASGSHVCTGNIGTFTANPQKNARNTHHCRPGANE